MSRLAVPTLLVSLVAGCSAGPRPTPPTTPPPAPASVTFDPARWYESMPAGAMMRMELDVPRALRSRELDAQLARFDMTYVLDEAWQVLANCGIDPAHQRLDAGFVFYDIDAGEYAFAITGNFQVATVNACFGAPASGGELVHGHRIHPTSDGQYFTAPADGIAVFAERPHLERILDPGVPRARRDDALSAVFARADDRAMLRIAAVMTGPLADSFAANAGDVLSAPPRGVWFAADFEYGAAIEAGAVLATEPDAVRAMHLTSESALEEFVIGLAGRRNAYLRHFMAVTREGTAVRVRAELTSDQLAGLVDGVMLGGGAAELDPEAFRPLDRGDAVASPIKR